MSDPHYHASANAVAVGVKREIGYLNRIEAMKTPFHTVYHLADANLRHFLPKLGMEERKDVISEVFYEQRMALSDYKHHGLIDSTRVADLAQVFDNAASPRIYCLYHVGSYRHFFHFLARANIDCALFIAEKTLAVQEKDIREGENKMWPGRLEMINAEAGNSLLRGARALKRGQSVAIYIDGNSGSGANWESDRLQPVEFFGKILMARTGIGYLSHLSGVPVVPVMCMRDQAGALSLTLHPPLDPNGRERADYVHDVTQGLYSLLEREIDGKPGQWEGWLYVHRYLQSRKEMAERVARPGATLGDVARVKANLDAFAVLDFGGKPLLLDKERHSFSILDEPTADLFRKAVGIVSVRDETPLPSGAEYLFNLGALEMAEALATEY